MSTGLLTLRNINDRLPHIVVDCTRWPVIVTDVLGVDDQGDILLKIVRPADNLLRCESDIVGESLISYMDDTD
jgi:hypothetical protein